MAKSQSAPVTRRALVQRINRSLAKDGEQMKATRGNAARVELGDYYIVDLGLNAITKKRVSPEELGRKLGVLQPYETVIE